MQKLLVIGGNGFVGSAICKQAVASGFQVSSLSRSGKPYASAKGHRPSWSYKVEWNAGSALDPASYEHLLGGCTAVVHTLGILLESDYKSRSVFRTIADRFLPVDRNPLNPQSLGLGKYEEINRDSAIAAYRTFQNATSPISSRQSFVYISAEDVFRPMIPSRYITTKRDAEKSIQAMHDQRQMASVSDRSRPSSIYPIFIRPSLIYHPHIRPLSTLPATLLDLSANIQAKLPLLLQAQTGAAALSTVSMLSPALAQILPKAKGDLEPFTASMANLLSIPPIHVDTIAEAVVKVLKRTADAKETDPELTENIYGVKEMRQLVGFDQSPNQDEVNAAAA